MSLQPKHRQRGRPWGAGKLDLRPPGLDVYLEEEAERYISKKRKKLPPGPIPEDFHLYLRRLCEFIAYPELLLYSGFDGDAYRHTFARAFAASPSVFCLVLAHVSEYYRHLPATLRALRGYDTIRCQDARGRWVTKPIGEASIKELDCFASTLGKTTPGGVARARSRLAAKDAAKPQGWEVLYNFLGITDDKKKQRLAKKLGLNKGYVARIPFPKKKQTPE